MRQSNKCWYCLTQAIRRDFACMQKNRMNLHDIMETCACAWHVRMCCGSIFKFNYFSTFFWGGGRRGGTLSLDLTPPVFFFILHSPGLEQQTSDFEVYLHTTAPHKQSFAHICWSNKLFVPDSPFPKLNCIEKK